MARWGGALVALTLGGCAGLRAGPPAEPVRLEVDAGELAGLETGLTRTLHVEVVNDGRTPVAVLGLAARGMGTGRRSLVVEGGRLRAFGYVPPGGRGRWRLGVTFATAGAGRLVVEARVREAAGVTGRLMEEVVLPAEGEERMVVRAEAVRVAPRSFPLAAAEARIGGRADDAVWCRELEAWVVVRGNDTFLVEVGQTTPFPGFALEAALLLDSDAPVVPILDEAGRVQEVPKGPALRALLDRARRRGQRVRPASTPAGEVLSVGP